jgi:ATP-dependent Clp protease ATP-binding subunit ClpA
MTSNLSGPERERQIGFLSESDTAETSAAELDQRLSEYFRPEFLNRIDRVVPFRPLRLGDYTEILDRRVKHFETVIERSHGSRLLLTDEVRRYLSEMGVAHTGGARAFIKECELLLFTPLLEYLKPHQTTGVVEVTLNDNQLTFRQKKL